MLDLIIHKNDTIPGWLPVNDLAMLLTTIQASRSKTYVEIGTYLGKSAAAVSAMPTIEKVISIDIFDPTMIGEDHIQFDKRPQDSISFMNCTHENISKFGKSDKVSIIKGRSEEVTDKVNIALDGQQIDFLFIDGEHSSKQVMKDYTIYKPLMAANGIIAFHDVARNQFPAASKAFEYIREQDDHRVYLKSPKYGSIGFIYLNGKNMETEK